MTFGTRRWWVCQPHAPAAFTPEMFLVLIFTRGRFDPRAMQRSKGDMSLKNPVIPPGIDLWTVRLVAQRLNLSHYVTQRPSEFLLDFLNVTVTVTICLPPVIDCSTSPTCGVQRNAGTASGGALDRRLSVEQKKRHPIFASRHGVIFHKARIFSNSAMRISNIQKKSVMTHFSRMFPLSYVRTQQTT
jgi:hypothetical protein